MSSRLLWLALLWAALARPATPTFSTDIAPIIYQSCAPCHHSGGLGPFPLTSYQEVRKHAAQIAAVTTSRYMPPWPPDPGIGDFVGDRHLRPDQIQLISAWVKAGSPPGDPQQAPPAPQFADSRWQLGKPDLVLRMPKPFALPAAGPDLFRNFVIPSSLSKARYVRAFELRLNTPRGVHHANVVLDRTRSLRVRDGQDGQPGFPGMDVTTEAAANDFDPDSHFLFWKPATALQPEPPERSWRLDPQTDLILNLHLQPTGKPEAIEAEIGLYFASQPPTEFPMLLQLEHDDALHIPPGATSFTVSDHLTLPVPVQLLAIYPHAHYLGKIIEASATLPDGKILPLIRISNWDINWQATYDYRQPISLPAGTRVAMRITYDNSLRNPRNPNHPPKLVNAGNRSQDEMGHVWLQVLPDQTASKSDDPRWPLQEAAMRRRLEKDPRDFLANYNLAAFLQGQGRLPEAAELYRRALAADTHSATAHNSLGSVFLAQDHPDLARKEFEQALAADGRYTPALYNLARLQAAAGETAGAAATFRQILTLTPDDEPSQAALGILLFRDKNYAEARRHLQTAVQLNPDDADAQANLGTVLAITGDLPAAIQHFETALRLDPNQEAARRNLEHARSALAH